MGKFSNVVQGVRARKPIKLPLPGAQVDGDTGEWLGPTVELDVRVLREDEHTVVLKEALGFARKNGLEEPGDGDPLYEQGKMLHTLAIACIDRESPKEDPAPFFDGGWEHIYKSEVMTPEVVAYLYQQQQIFQDEVNPLLKTMSAGEYMAAAIKTAQGDMSFFVNSRPGMQWSFLRTTVRQLLHLQSLSSTFSTSSDKPEATPS